MKNDIKIRGSLTLKRIDYNRILVRKVMRNNDTSGKVTLPVELIGKVVYVIIPIDEAKQ